MSAKELDRLEVIQRVSDSRLSQVKAGELLCLTSRQVRRLCRALEAGGPGGLVSRKARQLPRSTDRSNGWHIQAP